MALCQSLFLQRIATILRSYAMKKTWSRKKMINRWFSIQIKFVRIPSLHFPALVILPRASGHVKFEQKKSVQNSFMLRSRSSLFSPFTLASQQDIPPALQAEITVTRRQSNLPFQETFSTTQYKSSKKNACFNVSVSTTLIFKGLTPFYPSPLKKTKKRSRLVGLKPISEAVGVWGFHPQSPLRCNESDLYRL